MIFAKSDFKHILQWIYLGMLIWLDLNDLTSIHENREKAIKIRK